MNAEVQELWVNALRSKEYKQGFEALRSNEDCFCVLGVLCDLAVKKSIINEPEQLVVRSGGPLGAKFEFWYGGAWLPPAVVEWAGMQSSSGRFQFPSSLSRPPELHPLPVLYVLNDEGRLSFEELANLIETYGKYL